MSAWVALLGAFVVLVLLVLVLLVKLVAVVVVALARRVMVAVVAGLQASQQANVSVLATVKVLVHLPAGP